KDESSGGKVTRLEPSEFEPELSKATMTSDYGETQPGSTMGTPSYMSPEQVRGELEKIGPASDVYSLGATLYELLTDTLPYPGKTAPAIVAMVREGKLV